MYSFPVVPRSRFFKLCPASFRFLAVNLLLLGFFGRGLVPATAQTVLANGVVASNLGKGDWIWEMPQTESRLGVSTTQAVINYEVSMGMKWITVKCGDGTSVWSQFSSTLVQQAHAAGLKIFGWGYAYGFNSNQVVGEINVALNALNLGADGFIIDAETEYETNVNNKTFAAQYCQGIRAGYPSNFLAHCPFPYISYHSAFPYATFGYYCDAVMPQDYWIDFQITPTNMVSVMDSQWTTWQNGLTGTNRNAIKPIIPLGQSFSASTNSYDIDTGAQITQFVQALKGDTTPATAGGYLGVSFWDCQARNSDMDSGLSAATIGGPTAPVITVQPQSKTAIAGNNVTLSVTATGTSPFTYFWYFNSNIYQIGTAYQSITITNVQTTNAGIYYVKVANSVTNVISSNATLTVTIPPVITAQPQNVTIAPGNNATFSVTATGTPAPSYQWQSNGTSISFATASTYTITNVQLSNQATYSVVVANIGGSVGSSNAVLVVTAPPVFTTQPRASQTVNAGKSAIFTPAVSGSPTLFYQWYYGLADLSSATPIVNATNVAYVIPSATPAMAGNYWLVASNVYGVTPSTVSVLAVNGLPAITTQPQSQSVASGGNATFSVVGMGTPAPAYQWNFNGTPIAGASNAVYTVLNALTNNAGNYSVTLTNTNGAILSSVVTLTVIPPVTTPLQFQSITLLSNGAVQMQLTGSIGASYEIDASSNLINWIPLTNFINSNGTYLFLDGSASNLAGFYRGKLLSN